MYIKSERVQYSLPVNRCLWWDEKGKMVMGRERSSVEICNKGTKYRIFESIEYA